MNTNIKSILLQFKHGHVSLADAESEILDLNAENTEGVSISSRTESGVSHGVSDRNASRSISDELSEEVVGGTLALRTEEKEDCKCVASCLLKRHGFTSYFEGREYNCKQSG